MPLAIRAIDFVGYNQRGQVVLLAEAKSQLGTTDQWAAQLRRNILAHGSLPPAPFFLIATPDRVYIWKQKESDMEAASPDLVLEARHALGPYFAKLGRPISQLGREAFQHMVHWWLNDLALSTGEMANEDSSLRWLAESGFLDCIRTARIEHQTE
jgi:hypothetical protein